MDCEYDIYKELERIADSLQQINEKLTYLLPEDVQEDFIDKD